MAHPTETLVRDAYAAFGRGDLDGYLRACTDDFAFHVPRGNALSGMYRGTGGMRDLAGKVMARAGTTFREDVNDVLVNDRHAVVLAHHSLERNGVSHEYHTVHVYALRGGKLAECWEHPGDAAAFAAVWGGAASRADAPTAEGEAPPPRAARRETPGT